jgi:hypothetical protein
MNHFGTSYMAEKTSVIFVLYLQLKRVTREEIKFQDVSLSVRTCTYTGTGNKFICKYKFNCR